MSERKLLDFAKNMRYNPTKAEKILWYALRMIKTKDYKFRRQNIFDDLYIVDFVCFKKKLIIEIDGSGHNQDEIIEYDKKRTSYFEERGYKVLRFWNNQVLENLENVIMMIEEELKEQDVFLSPSPLPSPARGEGAY